MKKINVTDEDFALMIEMAERGLEAPALAQLIKAVYNRKARLTGELAIETEYIERFEGLHVSLKNIAAAIEICASDTDCFFDLSECEDHLRNKLLDASWVIAYKQGQRGIQTKHDLSATAAILLKLGVADVDEVTQRLILSLCDAVQTEAFQ